MIDTEKSHEHLEEWGEPDPWTARAGRRDAKAKLAAGLRGLKYAMRGDSSFFAHAYRGLLIVITAGLLGVSPFGWLFLVLAAALVLVAELMHSAVDTLARTLGDAEAPGPKIAREIASAAVLIAVVTFAAVSIVVLLLKLNELLGWWK